MHTTTILIALGLVICLPAFTQENLLQIPGISHTGTNAIKEPIGILAELPTVTIKPGDVVQASIECLPDTTREDISRNGYSIPLPPNYPTNAFRVRWRFTDEAAKQTLALREKHEGQIMRTVIGSFSRTPTHVPIRPLRILPAEEMKSRWLAKPVDGIWGLTEEQAKQMVVDLKSK
jgi:hypothetical protein